MQQEIERSKDILRACDKVKIFEGFIDSTIENEEGLQLSEDKEVSAILVRDFFSKRRPQNMKLTFLFLL